MSKREIKFRIWDKQLNKFLYKLPQQHHVNWKRFDVQQFTGLLDKRDKEIYEGDIVRSGKEYNDYTGLNSDLYGGNKYEVKSNGWRFFLSEPSIYQVDLSDLEVIGNIYENKELIKE